MSPLDHIKVLDLTRLAPGPHCTMILGDLGAQVLKIEEPGPPTGRRAEQAAGQSTAWQVAGIDRYSPFNALNRNKRSMGLNLKTEAGRDIFLTLAAGADVVVEEFRPGVAKRLGIDYEEVLRPHNPRLIYCAVTGYGQDGPYSRYVGHDLNYIAIAGALGIMGPANGPPAIPHNLLADFAGGGMHAAIGILAALMARERSGRGQFVDIAMADGVLNLQAALLGNYFGLGMIPPRGESFLDGAAPFYNVYQTQDDKWMSIGAIEPWFYANLCKALGCADLLPYEFDRSQWPHMRQVFENIFRTKTRDQWFALLTQTDVCVGPVYTYDELEHDPHLQARQMFLDIPTPDGGTVKQVGISLKLSDTPGQVRSLAPRQFEHTDAVLQELGYSAEDIDRLQRGGVVK
jgi:crotonobetainyl-CoA:carnitine CoA-transferase CaiB-like acyl-CoA transferase